MVKARKKLSKSAIILLALLFIGLITVIVLGVIGYISLAFVTNGLTGLAKWMAQSWINVSIILGVSFVAGMGVFYWLKAYIIGEEQVLVGTTVSGYNPTPAYPSAPAAQPQETEIS